MRCGIACRRLGSTTTRPSEANHRVIGISKTLATEHRSLEPAAAVSEPPRDVSDRNGRAQRPPDRQNEIGGQAEHGEREPEDLPLHTLDCKSFPPKGEKSSSEDQLANINSLNVTDM